MRQISSPAPMRRARLPIKRPTIMLAAAIMVASPAIHAATLATPNWIASHMVLQSDKKLPIWGTGTPRSTVTVSLNGPDVTAGISISNAP